MEKTGLWKFLTLCQIMYLDINFRLAQVYPLSMTVYCFFYMCFAVIVQGALVKILLSFVAYTKHTTYMLTCFCRYYISPSKPFSFCIFYSHSNLKVFRTMIVAAVIDFISTQCLGKKKINLLYLINIQIYLQLYLWRLRLHHSITKTWRHLHCLGKRRYVEHSDPWTKDIKQSTSVEYPISNRVNYL